MRALLLVVVVGCGRIAFDPRGDANDDGRDARVTMQDAKSDLLLDFQFESDGLFHDRASGLDATCTTCPTTEPGRTGGIAAHFDGTQCLHVPAGALQPTMFTFSTWARPTMDQDTNVMGRGFNAATTSANTFEVFFETGPSMVDIAVNVAYARTQVSTGTWHHIAGVFDGDAAHLYVDGVPGAVAMMLGPANYSATDEVTIGCDIDNGAEVFKFIGGIDDVRLYGRTLSAAEVAALAQ